MMITFSLPLLSSLIDRWEAFWNRLHEAEEYTFRLELEADALRHCRFLYLAYLRQNPHRYGAGRLREVPEFVPLLAGHHPGQVRDLTRYVLACMAAPRDRFDFQRYAVEHRLLRGLLELHPWEDAAELCRIGEALFFLSPAGYHGLIYWPLAAYLEGVLAYGESQPLPPRLLSVLDLMAAELRTEFSLGYAHEVAHCQHLLQGIRWSVLMPGHPAAEPRMWATQRRAVSCTG